MKGLFWYCACLLLLFPVAATAATKISDQQKYAGGSIPRPETIWVYDFSATPTDVPAGSALTGEEVPHDPPQTQEEIDSGRKVGAAIAADLITQINSMGMHAKQADSSTQPQVNDLMIHGYLLSVVQGDKKESFSVGFGKGNADIKVAAEGFRMTEQGPQSLGSGKADAQGSKAPGTAVTALGAVAMHNPLGLIVSAGKKEHDKKEGKVGVEGREKDVANTMAGELKKRFQEQGWIK